MKCLACKGEHNGTLKTCDRCRKLHKQYYREHKKEALEYNRSYYLKNRKKIIEGVKEWIKNNVELVARRNKEYSEKYPLRYKAGLFLKGAIRRKEIPHARALICGVCGKQAGEYHHHNGYEPEHWLDVMPLCTTCHKRTHIKQKEVASVV